MTNKIYYLLIFITTISIAQTKYEPGYYIDNLGNKHVGFIKNLDWRSNPKEINFKNSLDDSNDFKLEFNKIEEFTISTISKYKKFSFQIERSSNKTSQISDISEPVYENDTAFLKVLVEGESSLYAYNDLGLEKYFYSTPTIPIEQLIFIKYLVDKVSIVENDEFRKQLFKNTNCNIKRADISKVSYNENSLKNYFQNYNTCINSSFINFGGKEKKTYNFKGVLIANSNSLDFNYGNSKDFSYNFGNSLDFGFGFEVEAFLPFNNDKWSLFVEPTYNIYNKNVQKENAVYGEQTLNAKYNHIQFPVGVRHYFYINDKSNIFINVLYNFRFSTKNNGISFQPKNDLSDFFPSHKSPGLGIGYSYDKFYFEYRYISKIQLLNDSNDIFYANYKSMSISLRYQLF